jgi:hypothetical protein
MAAGATSMALVAAAILGISWPSTGAPGATGHRLAMNFTGAVWISLGLAMFRSGGWTPAPARRPTFGSPAPSAHSHPLIALFFAAIYLVSGGAIFEPSLVI